MPPPAPEQGYLAIHDNTNMSFGVLVQIGVCGTDNRYMLKVLQRDLQGLRGVRVVASDTTDRKLEAMLAAGVRGLRINVLFGGGIGFATMETLAPRIKDFGGHMQFLMGVKTLLDLMLRRTKPALTRFVDRMGHTPVDSGLTSPGFAALPEQVIGRGYLVKLSVACRISEQGGSLSLSEHTGTSQEWSVATSNPG
ncbi:putative TIM-barrel fold metal-dependent hydrolase [Paraburkholderia sp. GAS334]